ncbi:MAG: beta-galactosidase [Lentisphaeria bacterium]
MKFAALLTATLLIPAALAADPCGSVVTNGVFAGPAGGHPDGWTYAEHNGVQAAMTLVPGAGLGGTNALRITNASKRFEHVAAELDQTLTLAKGEKYRVSFWAKGEAANGFLFIFGKAWDRRFAVGDIPGEWKRFEFDFTPDAPAFAFDGTDVMRVVTEDLTQELLISKLEIRPVNALVPVAPAECQENGLYATQRLTVPLAALDRIPAGLPALALPADAIHFSPAVMPAPADFSARAAFAYDDSGLTFLVEVTDNELATVRGESLWRGDSVQLLIDQNASFSEPPDAQTVEIGLSPGEDGASPESWCYNLYRPLTAKEAELKSVKTRDGYFLAAKFPWSFLKAVDRRRGFLSANLIINESDGAGRRVAFLQSGIHDAKSAVHNTLFVLDDGRQAPALMLRGRIAMDKLAGKLAVPGAPGLMTLHARSANGAHKRFAVSAKGVGAPGPGSFSLAELDLDLADFPPGPITFTATANGRPVGQASIVKKDSFNEMKLGLATFNAEFAKLEEAALPCLAAGVNHARLTALLAICRTRAELLAKDATMTVANQERIFYGERGLQTLAELNDLLQRGYALVADLKATPQAPQYAFTPVAAAAPRLQNGWFMAKGKDGAWVPAIYSGYGHFGKCVEELPLLSSLGHNAIQIETGGPRAVIKGENPDGSFIVDTTDIERHWSWALNRCAENNTNMILLMSPHYFPEWVLEKYPELKADTGFIGFKFGAPYVRRLMNAYFRETVKALRKLPHSDQIQSLCLANEPTFRSSFSKDFFTVDFAKHLETKYRTVAALNAAWGTALPSFAAAAGDSVPAWRKDCDGRLFDYHDFAQQYFADWHRELAAAVKAEWPDMPVHVKIMNHAAINPVLFKEYNVDPERFSALSDLNGNDSEFVYKRGHWQANWNDSAMSFTLQRSFRKAEIVNSENHIIEDRSDTPRPYDFIYTAMFQQHLYGLGSSALWVWEDYTYPMFKEKHDFTYDIYRRPLNIYAASAATQDAMRLAKEVKTFFDAEPEVAIYYSQASAILDPRYLESTATLFQTLSFTGRKLGFLSEKQICEGRFGTAKLLFLPAASRAGRATIAALAKSKLAVIAADAPAFEKDEYGKPLDLGKLKLTALGVPLTVEPPVVAAVTALADARLGALPFQLQAQDSLTGIDWKLIPEAGGSFLLNACNYNEAEKPVKLLSQSAAPFTVQDLVACRPAASAFSLQPLQPVLLRITPVK